MFNSRRTKHRCPRNSSSSCIPQVRSSLSLSLPVELKKRNSNIFGIEWRGELKISPVNDTCSLKGSFIRGKIKERYVEWYREKERAKEREFVSVLLKLVDHFASTLLLRVHEGKKEPLRFVVYYAKRIEIDIAYVTPPTPRINAILSALRPFRSGDTACNLNLSRYKFPPPHVGFYLERDTATRKIKRRSANFSIKPKN